MLQRPIEEVQGSEAMGPPAGGWGLVAPHPSGFFGRLCPRGVRQAFSQEALDDMSPFYKWGLFFLRYLLRSCS